MKKLLLIVCVLAAHIGISQTLTTSGGTMTLLSATPSDICQCDTATLKLKVRIANGANPNTDYYSIFIRYGMSSNQYSLAITISNSDLFVLPKVQGQFLNDTIYDYKWKVPCNFISTFGEISNNQSLCSLTFDKLSGSTSKSFRVIDCVAAGISSYNLDPEKPIYYDLRGNIIEPRNNELIIERVGLKRRKVIIQK